MRGLYMLLANLILIWCGENNEWMLLVVGHSLEMD